MKTGMVWGATFLLGAVMQASTVAAAPAPRAAESLESVRSQISNLERELVDSRDHQASASQQLKKIRKLLALQKKEIQLSRLKISELNGSLLALSKQREELSTKITQQKRSIREKLRQLDYYANRDTLDAGWIKNLDLETQKIYFLSKTLRKDFDQVASLKSSVSSALALEMKIIDERAKLDSYVAELSTQIESLAANEKLQQEILKTNRSNRLEALARVRNLKDSEQALEKMLGQMRAADLAPLKQNGVLGLAALKGKLPMPASGSILSAFGKNYNPKTNLLTFQKGITVGTTADTLVKAVAGGVVAFVGPLKNYGDIVIVEHPGQFYTLYGQLGATQVNVGTHVKSGEVVGRTASEPLYFEIRNRNIAVNPALWLALNNQGQSIHAQF